jgi:4-oxalomesaconate tautomerase
MPVVVVRADAMGITGYERCADLEADHALRARLEEMRLAAGERMGLGDVNGTTVPKMAMVAPPRDDGDLCTRSFIPHRCHEAIGVLAAVSVATAALLPGTPANEVLARRRADGVVVLEHPTGRFDAAVEVDDGSYPPVVRRAGIVRTARTLMDGVVYPRSYA